MSEKDFNGFVGTRWHPNFRYLDKKFVDVPLKLFDSHDPSVTDKEAYRLTLASLRGELAQGSGKIDVGSYSIPAGQEYDPRTDFSFLNRKDLTIVELDEFIAQKKAMLEGLDESLAADIKTQLAKAEKTRQTLEKDTVNKNNEVKS